MAELGTALRNVTLDDKFDLTKDRVFITGTQAVVRLLLAHGADPLRATSDGTTPLDLARTARHDERARLLEAAASARTA